MTADILSERKRYPRDFLVAFREQPKCKELPTGLVADDLSDLSESVFFDKSPAETMYLGPQGGVAPGSRHSALIAGMSTSGAGRGHFGRNPNQPLHSRLVDDGTMSPGTGSDSRFHRNGSNTGLPTAFATSPSKGVPIAGRQPLQRYEDPARMDRWDTKKASSTNLQSPPNNTNSESTMNRGSIDADGNWTQVGHGNKRGGAAGGSAANPRNSTSIDGGSRPQTGSAPKESSRWGNTTNKDGEGDDWRARKAAPEPRYDWTDRLPGGLGGPLEGGSAARGSAAGGGKRGGGLPEWAEEETAPRGVMTAEDMEAERQRMQAEWRKSRGGGAGGTQVGEVHEEELVDDDEIERWKKEQEEEEANERRGGSAGGGGARAMPGQQVDMRALFGGGGDGGQQQQHHPAEEKVRSRFSSVFSMDESPNPSAAPPQLSGMVNPGGGGGGYAGAMGGGGPGRGPPPQQQLPPGGDQGRHLLAMLQKTGAENQLLGDIEHVATGIALGGLDDSSSGPTPQQRQQQQQQFLQHQQQMFGGGGPNGPPQGTNMVGGGGGPPGSPGMMPGPPQGFPGQQLPPHMLRPPQMGGPPPNMGFPPGMRPPHPGMMPPPGGVFPPGMGVGGPPRPGMFPPGMPPQQQFRPGPGPPPGGPPLSPQHGGGSGGGGPQPLDLLKMLTNAQQQGQHMQMPPPNYNHQAQQQQQQQQQQNDLAALFASMRPPAGQQQQQPPPQQQGMRQLQFPGGPPQGGVRPPPAGYTPQQMAQLQNAAAARMQQQQGGGGGVPSAQQQQQQQQQLMAMFAGLKPPQQ